MTSRSKKQWPPLEPFFERLRAEAKVILPRTLKAICGHRQPTATEKLMAWAAWEEWAAEEVRRFDYFNHPEIVALGGTNPAAN